MVLRLFSAFAMTLAGTFVYYKILPSKYDKKITLILLIMYNTCSSICAEFFPEEQCLSGLMIVLDLALLGLVFQDGLLKTYIVVFFGKLMSAAVSFIYGGIAGTAYRKITGIDEPLWISGENLNLAGLLLSLGYMGLWAICCYLVLPQALGRINRWSKKRCSILFVMFLILDFLLESGFGIADKTNAAEYIPLYTMIFILLLVMMILLLLYVGYMIYRKKQQNLLLERKIQQQYLEYKMIRSLQTELKEIRHDLRNLIASGKMEEYQDPILEYCDKIQKSLEEQK